MRIPKPITVLKALLFGADVKLPDNYTYRYDKGDEKHGPQFCIVAQMSNELGNYESCTIGSDLTLQQFIQLCEQLTEEQWVSICATNALMQEQLERAEKHPRHVQYGPVTLDLGPDDEERRLPVGPPLAVPDEETQRWKDACVNHFAQQQGSKICHDAHTFGCDPACRREGCPIRTMSTEETHKTLIPTAPKDPFQDLPWVGTCSRCGEPQYATPSGACCKNGHGGALSKEDS